ncbi:hypothetical protein AK812_SmicGene24705 [Symbiodinium microadriaticum]|uniref:Uncharacterized protein n=1 Tax=Symbiodinium microadriaticum TaxID=2951 RepID=A0A1Q9DDY4_SYMMI|nr:hypothetical protein AK812_SmicGene24705 [Symbiodinium microadriaticum]
MSLKIRVSRFEAVVVGLDWWILPMLRSLRTASKLLRRSSAPALGFGVGYCVCWAQSREELGIPAVLEYQT